MTKKTGKKEKLIIFYFYGIAKVMAKKMMFLPDLTFDKIRGEKTINDETSGAAARARLAYNGQKAANAHEPLLRSFSIIPAAVNNISKSPPPPKQGLS